MEQQKFTKKSLDAEITEQHRQKRSTRRIVFYVLLFPVLAALFAVMFIFVFLKVQVINVVGNSYYTQEEIISFVGISEGDNLMELLRSDKAASLSKKLPYIAEAEISVSLPHTVNINITETKPKFYTVIDGEGYLLSDKLKVLKRVSDGGDLPLLMTSAVTRCVIGEECTFADKREYEMIQRLENEIEANGITSKIKSIDIRNRFAIYMNYDDRFTVYVGNMEYIDVKVLFLVKVIEKLEATDKGKIDISNEKEVSVRLS